VGHAAGRGRSRSLLGVADFVAPDVLVLGAGGVVGEAWMTGVLAGLEDATDLDLRRLEAYVGTSAGAIVAARLAAGERPRRPSGQLETDERAVANPPSRGVLRTAARWGWAATAPLAPLATAAATPAGALARSALLARAPSVGRPLTRLSAQLDAGGERFDGRLRVCCVDKRSGRRVVFGAPGAPPASIGEAVAASCAVPWTFAPVRIGEREYVDGGVWSATNLDAAPAGRDSEVLCLDPLAVLRSPVRHAFRAAVAVELQVLRGRGARVRHVVPDAAAQVAMGDDLMANAPVASALAAGHRQGRALTRTPPASGA
jgi:NTE family protein